MRRSGDGDGESFSISSGRGWGNDREKLRKLERAGDLAILLYPDHH